MPMYQFHRKLSGLMDPSCVLVLCAYIYSGIIPQKVSMMSGVVLSSTSPRFIKLLEGKDGLALS